MYVCPAKRGGRSRAQNGKNGTPKSAMCPVLTAVHSTCLYREATRSAGSVDSVMTVPFPRLVWAAQDPENVWLITPHAS